MNQRSESAFGRSSARWRHKLSPVISESLSRGQWHESDRIISSVVLGSRRSSPRRKKRKLSLAAGGLTKSDKKRKPPLRFCRAGEVGGAVVEFTRPFDCSL